MEKLIKLGVLKLLILILALTTTLDSFPALAYSSGNTTIIETGRKSSYSLLDRKFIFDQAENKANSLSLKKSQELKPQNLTLFSQLNLKPVKQEETKISQPLKVIIQGRRDSLKNSATTNDLSKWDKFKESNNGIASTDEALNVNARILIKE
jgi:hypothetical protein